jgi:DNA-binding transcriptional LysR family regulator
MRSLLVGETLAQLSDGRVDVAIMLTDTLPQESAFRVRPLVAERFLLLAAPEHPLAHRSRVQAEDLHDETLLLTEAGCSYRLAFEQQLKTAGVRPSTIMEFGSVEAIKQCAMANLGIGFLPEIAACEEVKQGRLVALRWFAADFRMMTQLIWHRDKWLSVALSAFIEMTEQVLIPAGAPTGD